MSKEQILRLVNVQMDLHGRIARAFDNLKKLGTEKITISAAETRLESLEAYWKKFEAQHEKLLEHPTIISELDYSKLEIPDLAEESYHIQKSAFREVIRDLRSREIIVPQLGNQAAPAVPAAPKSTLPRIQLPQFSGRYEDWPAFRDLFQSIVDRNESISRVEKLHYLKTCIKGEAELLIRNYSTTAENYESAWKTLRKYYENKRLLVRSHLTSFLAIPRMKTESAVELRKVFHRVKATVSSLESIGRSIQDGSDLFVHLVVEMLDPRSRREWENSVCDDTEPANYEALEDFMERRLHMLEALLPPSADSSNTKPANGAIKATRSHLARKQDGKPESKRGRCAVCHKDHFIMWCEEYKGKTASERKQLVEDQNLCLNCLGNHKLSACISKKTCTVCSARHHTTIHDACRGPGAATTAHITQGSIGRAATVLLATARVRVADRYGVWHPVRALVDPGSESSLVSERCAQRLRLPRLPTSVAILGVCGRQTGTSKGRVVLNMTARFGGLAVNVAALVLPQISAYTGRLEFGARSWPHLQGMELADLNFDAADPIDLLLGVEVYATILKEGIRKGNDCEPMAQNTTLGWIVSGVVGENSNFHLAHTHQCRIAEDLSGMVRRFWEQEECPQPAAALSEAEKECEEHFRRTHSRQPSGRYTVRLPTIKPMPDFSDTRRASLRCLKQMEIRFGRDNSFYELYSEFMVQYGELGHMTPIPSSPLTDGQPSCYLPHHGVMREASSSTKLRVVFNGSSRVASGASLNQHLQTGQNLLPALADIILRWRKHRFVFATDIEKMYRQIDVHPQDRNLQRILWRRDPNEEIKEFQLNTVTYGLACAPFLAIRTLHQLAKDEEARFLLGASVLLRDVYMDDILSGADTLDEAKILQGQLWQICQAGGSPLKKWSANDASLIEDLPIADRLQQEPRWWLPGESHPTLGLRWHPHDDSFSFATSSLKELEVVTRRTILALTAKLFDPLGWLAPVTVRAKIRIQATWLLGLDWDACLPDAEVRQWREFEAELPLLEEIRINRWLGSGHPGSQLEIHGFADASERAYGAVTYLRTKNQDGSIDVRLMTSKTKVAPLKQVTLPRLELCAAVLLVRLAAHTRSTLGIKGARIHLWTDSTVALGWIRGHPTSWKTYVANRVSEIQTTLPDACWQHVPGKENPADCASRGLSPRELVDFPLWWLGPPWLRSDTEPRPARNKLHDGELPDRRSALQVSVALAEEIQEPEQLCRYSDLRRLIRITAWCRRWLSKRPASPAPLTLRAEELDEARLSWIRVVQAGKFSREVEALAKNKLLPARSSLLKLSPFLDEQGMLRVGGRLRHSTLSPNTKHPIILPRHSHLTKIIIEAHHRRTLHGGVQSTLASLRQEFWVPCGRTLVKSCIHHCLTCIRWRAASPQPLMGDLPAPRVTPTRPFLNTGVDYAGPVWLRTSPGRGQRASKAFIVVFICLASRAIHLDAVSNYTAEAFIAALRRFVSRRGICHSLYSDCGTNFVGADSQLRDLFTASSREGRRIATLANEERIRWHFNPPAAPNFGGLWEAAVKSMKHHLRRVIGDAKLTYEEMATLLSQIEACLNSRPLQAMTDDPEDLDALTPGHLLIGSALTAVPAPSLAEEPTSRLCRWRVLQQMRDHFWDRWMKEYLHTLSHRPKWCRADSEIRVGRLCLIRNELTPPTRWPLARVERIHPGQDGHVRVVTVRTATSSFTRPASKLVLLPVSETTKSDT